MTTPLRHRSRRSERLTALIVAAAVLFCPPLLLVIDRLPSATGIWLLLYLFVAWAFVIGLAAWLQESRRAPAKGRR